MAKYLEFIVLSLIPVSVLATQCDRALRGWEEFGGDHGIAADPSFQQYGVPRSALEKLGLDPGGDPALFTIATEASWRGTRPLLDGATIRARAVVFSRERTEHDELFSRLRKAGVRIGVESVQEVPLHYHNLRALERGHLTRLHGTVFVLRLRGPNNALVRAMLDPSIVEGVVNFGRRAPGRRYDRELSPLTLHELVSLLGRDP